MIFIIVIIIVISKRRKCKLKTISTIAANKAEATVIIQPNVEIQMDDTIGNAQYGPIANMQENVYDEPENFTNVYNNPTYSNVEIEMINNVYDIPMAILTGTYSQIADEEISGEELGKIYANCT